MTPQVRKAMAPMLRALDAKVHRDVQNRIDAMERELIFLGELENKHLLFIREKGWRDDRLQLLFALNSVYQHVLGPLQASAKEGPVGLGSTVPIRHGAAEFSRQRTGAVVGALKDFNALVQKLDFRPAWLQQNTCRDVVYEIAIFLNWEEDKRP